MTDDNVIDIDAPYGRKKDGTPKKKHSGGFARGGAAHAGPPKGEGWGGPAKGAGSSAPVGPKPENMRGAQGLGPPTPTMRETKRLRDLAKEEAEMIMREKLFTLGQAAEREETQLSAAVAFLNRSEGMPIARQLTAEVDKEDIVPLELVARYPKASGE